MRKGLTELVFILDRSGSMQGLEGDTIGGYNSFLEKQRQEPGEALVTTVLFDDRWELLHDRTNLLETEPITGREYFVRGSTALLDAVGLTIHKVSNAQKQAPETERAERVVVVIITDGMENASSEYTYEAVRQLIERQRETFGWEFIFLGANIDAAAESAKIGITRARTANFKADGIGTRLNYEVLNDAVKMMRKGEFVAESWKERIEEDAVSERDGKGTGTGRKKS